MYTDAKAGGDLWTHLARAKRRRKRRCPRQDGRGRGVIPGRRGIETRPLAGGNEKQRRAFSRVPFVSWLKTHIGVQRPFRLDALTSLL